MSIQIRLGLGIDSVQNRNKLNFLDRFSLENSLVDICIPTNKSAAWINNKCDISIRTLVYKGVLL